ALGRRFSASSRLLPECGKIPPEPRFSGVCYAWVFWSTSPYRSNRVSDLVRCDQQDRGQIRGGAPRLAGHKRRWPAPPGFCYCLKLFQTAPGLDGALTVCAMMKLYQFVEE